MKADRAIRQAIPVPRKWDRDSDKVSGAEQWNSNTISKGGIAPLFDMKNSFEKWMKVRGCLMNEQLARIRIAAQIHEALASPLTARDKSKKVP